MSQSNELPRYFTGTLQDGKIYEQYGYNDYRQIGVVQSVYQDLNNRHEELKKSYNEYQEKLIELKVIEPPLSPEEIAQKQAEVIKGQSTLMEKQTQEMAEMRQMMGQLASQMKSMMEATHEHNVNTSIGCRCGQRSDGDNEQMLGDSSGYAKKSRGTPGLHKSKQR